MRYFFIPYCQSSAMFGTSFLFFVPTLYSMYRGFYWYSRLNGAIAFASVNHWRNPIRPSWRRTLDYAISYVGFCLYLKDGILNLDEPGYLFGSCGLFWLLYYYINSHFGYYGGNTHWRKHHAMFHVMVVYQQMLILLYL